MTDIVAAILVQAGRVLLGHRAASREWYPDVWDLPGGHVEPGEEPAAALVRELKEELGISVAVAHLTPADGVELDGGGFTLRVWTIEHWKGEISNTAAEEHDELGWFALHELDDLALADDAYRSLLADALARRHLCVLPTGPIVAGIEDVRRRWDPVMAAIAPAHLTVVYPEESDDEGLLLRRAAAADRRPLRLRLGEVFAHDGGVFIRVYDQDGDWRDLRRELLAPPFRVMDITPHITLIHPRTSKCGRDYVDEMSGTTDGEIAFTGKGNEFEAAELLYTDTSNTFTVLRRFPFLSTRPA